jgi:hypothetical protein
MPRQWPSSLDRLMENVSPEPNTGCWLWTGAYFWNDYGMVSVNDHTVRAHRWAWTVLHGPIPDGLWVLHKCDNPACVNAETHLYLGTVKENGADKSVRRRIAGERNPHSKLTQEQVDAIRREWRERCGRFGFSKRRKGEITQAELARRYGVTQPHVSGILRGATWK